MKLGTDVFFDPPFKLEVETGGALMRGLVFRQYRGDTDVRATLEYILPLFTISGLSVRMIGFYDTNLTWFRSLPDAVVAAGAVRRARLRPCATFCPIRRRAWCANRGTTASAAACASICGASFCRSSGSTSPTVSRATNSNGIYL